jgi:hypothetical protein
MPLRSLERGTAMDSLVGFHVDGWDYLTFAAMSIIVAATLTLVVLILGLPGRIAIARRHPEAEAVNLMGYLGFLAVVPWLNAFMWAFKPTDVIDIRNLPREEKREIDAMLARLAGKTAPPEQTSKPSESHTS